MVDILGLLPILNGWNWIRITGDEELKAGQDPVTLYASEDAEFGWLISARMSANVADIDLRIRYDPTESGQTLDFNLNPEELYSAGYYSKSNMPYVTNYDPVNNAYAAEFKPEPPLSLKGTLTVRAMPGSSDGELHYDVLILQVTDLTAFVDSLRAVFGISTIIDLLNNLGVTQPEKPIEIPKIAVSEYTGFLP